MSKYFQNSVDNKDFLANYDSIPAARHGKGRLVGVIMPNGTYNARIYGWIADDSQEDRPYVRLTYEVLDEEYAGKMLAHFRSFTEAAAPWSREFFDSLGIDPRKDVSDYPPIYVEVKTRVKDGENGKQYVEVVNAWLADPPASTAGAEKAEGTERTRRKPRSDVPGAL